MGRKVRKTLNIDGDKLKRVQRYLDLDTETEVIDRMLDDYEFERELAGLLRSASPAWKRFQSPLILRRRGPTSPRSPVCYRCDFSLRATESRPDRDAGLTPFTPGLPLPTPPRIVPPAH